MGYADYKDQAKATREAAANLAKRKKKKDGNVLETIFTEVVPIAAGVGTGLATGDWKTGAGVYGGVKSFTKGIADEDPAEAIKGAGKGYMAVKGGMEDADKELVQLYQTEGPDALDEDQMERLLELDEMTQPKGHSFGKGKSE